jgi:glycosyltransferase involved in cell wall biosynthesis
MLSWFQMLPQFDWQIAAVFVQREGNLAQAVRDLGLEVVTGTGSRFRNVPAYVTDVRRIARAVRRTKADIVHSSGAKGHLYGGVAARLAGVPAFWFLHDRPEASMWMRLARRVPGHCAADSESTADAAVEWFGRRPPVVHEAVDIDRFLFDAEARRRVRAEWGWDDSVLVAGYVGRLQAWKGVDLFLDGLAEAIRRQPSLKGVVVGSDLMGLEPDYEPFLHRRATDLGLYPDAIRFMPFQTDSAPIYSAIDCLVHVPTKPEPFGRSVIEAMAAGRWVIASNHGGPAETVTPQTGALVTPRDASVLALALIEFAASPGQRQNAIQEGPARARQFDAVSSAQKLARVLAEVVA